MAISYSQILYSDTVAELPATAMQGQLAYIAELKFFYQFSDGVWGPNGRIHLKRGIANINGLAIGNTLIYTLENTVGYGFIPLFIHVEAMTMTNVITPPSLSIGTNSPNYNNILNATGLDSILNTTGIIKSYNSSSTISIAAITPGTSIYARVSLGAIATAYTIRVDIIGYYNRIS